MCCARTRTRRITTASVLTARSRCTRPNQPPRSVDQASAQSIATTYSADSSTSTTEPQREHGFETLQAIPSILPAPRANERRHQFWRPSRDPIADVRLPWLPDIEPATYFVDSVRLSP